MKKITFVLTLILLTVASYAQEIGIAIYYQTVNVNDEFVNNQANLVFIGSEHIIVNYTLDHQEYYWRDSIVNTWSVDKNYDMDRDGTLERITIRTYATDNGGVYKLVINEGSPFMMTTESQVGQRISFAGCISYGLTYEPIARKEMSSSVPARNSYYR